MARTAIEKLLNRELDHKTLESVDQLANVKGIGLKTVEKNREMITLSGTKAAVAAKS